MDDLLVVDVGGTKIAVAILDCAKADLEIKEKTVFNTPTNPEHAIQRIIDFVFASKEKVNGLSLSLPGKWDKKGVLKESVSLSGWLEYPFIENLARELHVSKYCWESDVICGGLGEYKSLDMDDKTLLYINLGTGIGASLIKDGKPYKHSDKLTLRLQKLVSSHNDEICDGVDFISGRSLAQMSGYKSTVELFEECKKGEIVAIDVLLKAHYQLAALIINLFYLFAPDVIVLNGGLTDDWEVLAEPAIDIANEELNNAVEILPSKLKETAPIYGAVINCFNSNKNSLS